MTLPLAKLVSVCCDNRIMRPISLLWDRKKSETSLKCLMYVLMAALRLCEWSVVSSHECGTTTVLQTGGLRTIGLYAPTVFLFARQDHWSPECHLEDLERLQKQGVIPPPGVLSWHLDKRLKHAFVGDPTQVDLVLHWCLGEIDKVVHRHLSKL